MYLAAGIEPRTRHRGGTEDHVLHMASAGLGVAISATLQPVVPGLIAEPDAVRRIIVAAVAGRPYGAGLGMFLKLMRARDWKREAQDRQGVANQARESKPDQRELDTRATHD